MKALQKKALTGLIIGAMSISILTPSITAENIATKQLNPNVIEQVEANSTALMIESNTGTNDILKPLNVTNNNTTIAKNSSGIVEVPSSPNSDPITIKHKNESLQISLPKLNTAEAIQTKNGTIVYQDATQPADLAVQITEDGVRSLIKIKDPSAPKEYKFTIDIPSGGKLVTSAEYMGEEFDTGEVFIIDSENIIQSVFSPAWAKDANGMPISTHYKVEGHNLVQVVEFTENTVFPVIADPDWIKIGKCSGALVAFVGGNLVAISKLIKIKKYIKSLGGFRETARLLVGATTWEERMRVGGKALVGLAAELSGATGVWATCK